MPDYDELRIELSPNLVSPGDWDVRILECPMLAMVGPKGKITPAFTRQQLRRLRSRNGWPNIGELRNIGESVWKSVMNAQVEAVFDVCRENSRIQGRRLRLVFSTTGEE